MDRLGRFGWILCFFCFFLFFSFFVAFDSHSVFTFSVLVVHMVISSFSSLVSFTFSGIYLGFVGFPAVGGMKYGSKRRNSAT